MYSGPHFGTELGTAGGASPVAGSGPLRFHTDGGFGPAGLSQPGDGLRGDSGDAASDFRQRDGEHLYGVAAYGTDHTSREFEQPEFSGDLDRQERGESGERALLLRHPGQWPEVDRQGARAAMRRQAELRGLHVCLPSILYK